MIDIQYVGYGETSTADGIRNFVGNINGRQIFSQVNETRRNVKDPTHIVFEICEGDHRKKVGEIFIWGRLSAPTDSFNMSFDEVALLRVVPKAILDMPNREEHLPNGVELTETLKQKMLEHEYSIFLVGRYTTPRRPGIRF